MAYKFNLWWDFGPHSISFASRRDWRLQVSAWSQKVSHAGSMWSSPSKNSGYQRFVWASLARHVCGWKELTPSMTSCRENDQKLQIWIPPGLYMSLPLDLLIPLLNHSCEYSNFLWVPWILLVNYQAWGCLGNPQICSWCHKWGQSCVDTAPCSWINSHTWLGSYLYYPWCHD